MKTDKPKSKRGVLIIFRDERIAPLVGVTDHKLLGIWAKNCAERVLPYFEAQLPALKIGGLTTSNFNAQIDRTASSVTAKVDVFLPTLLMQVGGGASNVSFKPESTVIYKSRKIELALVPAGAFVMGDAAGTPDEQPAHARDVHSHSGSRYSVFPQAPDTP